MKKNYPCTLLLLSICLYSCTRHAYYQSPFHTNTAAYRPIPLQSDSLHSATYASGYVTSGSANEWAKDRFASFTGSIHQSLNLGHFQALYGLTGMLGGYRVRSLYDNPSGEYERNKNLNPALINAQSGTKFFGGAGAFAGANVVVPLGKGSEWRALGAELCWMKEFGDYKDFRNALPDTAANIIARNSYYFTMGISTDFDFKIHNGSAGFKLAHVFSLNRIPIYDIDRKRNKITPGYFSSTFHISIQRCTGMLQFNLGRYASNTNIGFAYRINAGR